MARRLHPFLAVLLLASVGCVIPPPLELDQPDSQQNAAPAIVEIRGDDGTVYGLGDSIAITRGTGTMTIQLHDADLEDTLEVRVFVDYRASDPAAPRAACFAPPTEDRAFERTAVCDLRALCRVEDVALLLALDVDAYDRTPVAVGNPPFREVPAPGQRTSAHFVMACAEAL